MDLIKKTNIDFVTNRGFFLRLSLLASIIGMLLVLGPEIPGLGLPRLIEPGIDFTGGTQTTVSFANTATSAEQVRGALGKAGYTSAEIKSFGKDGDFLIRINDVQDDASRVSADLVTKLNAAFSKNGEKAVIMLGADNVGAKVSAELATDAAISLIIATSRSERMETSSFVSTMCRTMHPGCRQIWSQSLMQRSRRMAKRPLSCSVLITLVRRSRRNSLPTQRSR
jgi:preprotein translocase subunit SecF